MLRITTFTCETKQQKNSLEAYFKFQQFLSLGLITYFPKAEGKPLLKSYQSKFGLMKMSIVS